MRLCVTPCHGAPQYAMLRHVVSQCATLRHGVPRCTTLRAIPCLILMTLNKYGKTNQLHNDNEDDDDDDDNDDEDEDDDDDDGNDDASPRKVRDDGSADILTSIIQNKSSLVAKEE